MLGPILKIFAFSLEKNILFLIPVFFCFELGFRFLQKRGNLQLTGLALLSQTNIPDQTNMHKRKYYSPKLSKVEILLTPGKNSFLLSGILFICSFYLGRIFLTDIEGCICGKTFALRVGGICVINTGALPSHRPDQTDIVHNDLESL